MDVVSNSEFNITFGSGTLVRLFIWRLHARGRIEMRKKTLRNRLFTCETILLALRIVLILGVSFLELSFQTINYVTNRLVVRSNCVRLDVFYEPSTV